ARYLVFGAVQPGANQLEISAVCLDAETGLRVGQSRLQAPNRGELRLMMSDFAAALFVGPGEWTKRAAEDEQVQALLRDAQKQAGLGEFAAAIDRLDLASALRPNSVPIAALFDRYQARGRLAEMERAQQTQPTQRRELDAAAGRRRADLLRE